MSLLQWTTQMNTGITVIDNQHRQIVDFINDMKLACDGNDRAAMTDVFDGILEYTLSHFAFEEVLMRDAGYPLLPEHRKVHEMFAKRIARYKERFLQGEEIGEEVTGILSRWLVRHICSDDVAYVEKVRENLNLLVRETHEESWLARSLNQFFGHNKSPGSHRPHATPVGSYRGRHLAYAGLPK